MRILVTGASGRLGAYVVDELAVGRHEVVAWSGRAPGQRAGIRLRPVELTDAQALASALADADPGVIIHAAAVSSAERVYRDPAHGEAVNVRATRHLADWAGTHGRRMLLTSTDLVFTGTGAWYREDDPAEPILEYGRTKRAAESFVLATTSGVVARLALLYGPSPGGSPGFFDLALAAVRRGEPQAFFEDEFRSPLDYSTAARLVVRLAESSTNGIVHVAGRERLSRYELMLRALRCCGADPRFILANRQSDVPTSEPRPADVSLDTTLLASLFPDIERPSIEMALGAGAAP
jgi:dTDP-4-dehydrorhamnose reductase